MYAHTHCIYCMRIPLFPPVAFNPLEATVEVGSNITITCWSNQEAVLQLAYNQGPVLASSSGRSVIHTLVDVQENESGVIYCVGMFGEMSNTAEYHLTVCTLYGCVLWTCIIAYTYAD